jgi:hypothetical protein
MIRFSRLGMLVLPAIVLPVLAAHADTPAPSVADLAGLLPLFAAAPWAIYVLLGAAALPWLAAIVPQAPPGSGWAPARRVLDVLAGNVGNAANAALASPALAASLARPIPAAVFGIEHAAQLFLAGMQAGQAQGANNAPAPAPAAAAPSPPA